MENEVESASSSALAWRWTIEALASFDDVKPSLLHDVIDKALQLPENTRKNPGEMVALKCLEGLFGPLNYIGENGPPAPESKVMFDSSESCECVVKRICKETPKSSLRVAGPDMLKWEVKPFIDQKRASMHCALHQLKDAILDGTHPYADFLMQKSGLKPINKRDSISLNNEGCIEVSMKLDGSSSDPQGQKEKSPLLLEDARRISVVNTPSSSLLPSKRSGVDFTSEDEARQLSGCDNGYINVKKLKQHSAPTLYSGQEFASAHDTEVLEDSPERIVQQNERDDTNHLDEHQMTLVEDKRVEEEHFRSKKSESTLTVTDELHQGDKGIPCYTTLAGTEDGELLEVIGVKKVKNGSELPVEPKASNHSSAEGNLHNTNFDDFKCDSNHDYHISKMDTISHSGVRSKTVVTNIEVGMNPDKEENNILSDSDGYHERIDIAMKKKQFFSSQCMVDSFQLPDRRELAVCVKCNKGGQLLSCNFSDCPLMVHAKCLGSSARMNDEDDFCCPFCLYSLAISEFLDAKKDAALAKKNVATFSRTALEHQSIVIKEALQRKDFDPSQKAGVEDVTKICEDVDLENKDNQVTVDGEHENEVVEHQSTTVKDIERRVELSKTFNPNHRENEASPLRVGPDVLNGEKDGDELMDQECQRQTVAELVDQYCQASTVAGLVDQECQRNAVVELMDRECQAKDNAVAELVDQEYRGKKVSELVDRKCQGNVAELEDGKNTTEQHDIYEILHEDHAPIEAAATQEGLQDPTDDNEEEPACAIIAEGEKSSDDENDESIISRYSIRFRRKYQHCPETHQLRRKKLPWTAEEEETLLEGVRKFSSSVERSPTIPWTKILKFGSNVFLKDRTSIDLKDKWRNLCRSIKFK